MNRFSPPSIRLFSKLDLRTLVLLVVCGVLAGVLSWFLFSPASGHREVSGYAFPSTVVLPSWRLLGSYPLPQAFLEPATETREAEPQINFVLSGRAYRYQRGSSTVTIEMRYLIYSSGNLEQYYEVLGRSPMEALVKNLRHSQEKGYYAVFRKGDVSYLTACINPRGGSTVTVEQYAYNRRMLDSRPEYWIPWLFGKHSMRDLRCLWTELSLTAPVGEAQSFEMLEALWGYWYEHWERQFPGL